MFDIVFIEKQVIHMKAWHVYLVLLSGKSSGRTSDSSFKIGNILLSHFVQGDMAYFLPMKGTVARDEAEFTVPRCTGRFSGCNMACDSSKYYPVDQSEDRKDKWYVIYHSISLGLGL